MPTISLLTSQQAADRLALSVRTLEGWRNKGTGPAFIRINGKGVGATVRYDVQDLDRWVSSYRTGVEG